MSEQQAECKPQGLLIPVINRNRCEGRQACVEVCPYDVFAIQQLTKVQRASLSFVGRLKSRFHGYRQAFVVRGDRCHACGLCVTACPENAIELRRT